MRRKKIGPPHPEIRDYGPKPFVVNIDHATKMNPHFRLALWTGCHMQLTLMSIPVGGEIGLEMHEGVDQFIRIECGRAAVSVGAYRCALGQPQIVDGNYAVLIPAGTWHNIVNVGNTPLKLYSLYAPPNHPYGTVHPTKADAEAAEKY